MAVATNQFVQAAATQAAMLGTDPDYVWVPHPVQDRTDAELQAMADKYLDEILARLTAQVRAAAE